MFPSLVTGFGLVGDEDEHKPFIALDWNTEA